MPSRFDHAVVIVPSLKPAVRSLERLGFHVVIGGRTGPVHNALTLFSDGTYIEPRFLPWIGAPAGPIDWCIRVDEMEFGCSDPKAPTRSSPRTKPAASL